MPLLPQEPSMFPDDLMANPAYSLDGAERWWVLRTRPRAEKSLARRFFARKLPFYLPLAYQRWQAKGRIFKSFKPLFAGYVFLHGDAEVRLRALETNLVAQVLYVPDPDKLQTDLQRVHRIIASGSPLTSENGLQPGSWVAITQGPLAGLEGRILRRAKNLALPLKFDFCSKAFRWI